MSKTLPIIPMRSLVLFPGASLPVAAGRPQTLRAIEAALRDPEHRVFPVAQLEAGGKSIEGKLTLTEASYEHGHLYRQWLRDVSDGKIDHPSFTAAAKGERKAIALLDVDNRDITPTDRRGKVRDLDMVAVEKETKRTESGVCEFETSGTVTRARRFGVELEVTVSSLTDGHVVATKTFPAPSGCPSFEMLDPNDPKTAVRPRKEDITRWLESFVKS